MGCHPVSSRLITIRLRAVPFNITKPQVDSPTTEKNSDCDDSEVEEFYNQLQNVIDQAPKKDILVVQGDWNAKLGRNACVCSLTTTQSQTIERERDLEDASYGSLLTAFAY